ncbi:putative non-LTR retroelement reverse transcriptase [Trifolium medium]|uniref:Putative non-LTR retroelement reverse transcriptase n=1 Tax=Trifolium medium TaxID=97028 RepID=A0A392MJD5_9FABA|nr:putative non-LTR retroelement reverse transcriptase [Trifolium medium]
MSHHEFRDLRAVNLALLGKWRWRILSGGQGIWRDILLARYGLLYPSPHLGGRPVGFRGSSYWWRDVSLLGGSTNSISDRFSEGIGKKVGDGLLNYFWFEPWIGDTPLRVQYQRLFQVSEQRDSKVGEMGTWVDEHDATGIFSVKSAYSVVELASRVDVIPPEVSGLILAKVWKSWTPSKVIVFS